MNEIQQKDRVLVTKYNQLGIVHKIIQENDKVIVILDSKDIFIGGLRDVEKIGD